MPAPEPLSVGVGGALNEEADGIRLEAVEGEGEVCEL